MNKDEIDTMWQQSMQESIKDGEVYIRYHFAKLVAEREREACANICEELELPEWPDKVRQPLAQAIRTRGQA